MTGEFVKNTSLRPAVLGAIADPDEYNKNFGSIAKGAIVGFDADGNYADADFGDETLGSAGALIKDLKLRNGGALKIYNASGVLIGTVNLGQGTISVIGQTLLLKQIYLKFNASTPNSKMDFSDGNFQFDDGSGQIAVTAMSKTTSSWAAGNNNGGLDTGSLANNTYYYWFAIYNPTSGAKDFLFSSSPTSPTMPSGYTKKARIGGFLTDGSGNINQKYLCQTTLFGQVAYFRTGELATGAIQIPYDDSPPQNDEGTQFMECSIAPLRIGSKIKTDVVFGGTNSSVARVTGALFQDALVDALASLGTVQIGGAGYAAPTSFSHEIISSSNNVVSFKLRAGPDNPGTFSFNGDSGARKYGGVSASSIYITEY